MQTKFNPFRGIDKAPLTTGGAYTLPGNHIVELITCKIVQSFKKKTDMFIAEYAVVKSNNAECTPNSKRSWMVNFAHLSALSNIKNFAIAALNICEEDVDEDVCKVICEERDVKGKLISDSGVKGVILSANAYQVKTQVGGDFTRVDWEYVAGSMKEYTELN